MNLSARSNLLTLISTTIIFCGYATKAKTETPEVRVVTSDKIQVRGGLYYEVNQTAPFTGLVQDFYSNGQKAAEESCRDGKKHGSSTLWHENGQKKAEGNCKDGKQQGTATVWFENGQKSTEHSYKNGKKHGVWTSWDKNGQHPFETIWENGVKKN